MNIKQGVKRCANSVFYRSGVFPSRWQLGNPFKIGELTYLLRDVDLKPDDRVLDIGCGKGIQTQVIARRSGAAVGVDLSVSAITAAEELLSFSGLGDRVRFHAGNLYEDSNFLTKFDHIFSISVIEHVSDYLPLLKRAYDLLKPGGKIHLSVDSLSTIEDEEILTKHRVDHDVCVLFSVDTIIQTLSEAGFKDVSAYPIFGSKFARNEFSRRITEAGMYGRNLIWRYKTFRRLMREDVNFKGSGSGIFLIAHGIKKTG